jgi:hypothetical protein
VAAILSLPSLYGGNWKTELPLLHNSKINTPEGQFGNCRLKDRSGDQRGASEWEQTKILLEGDGNTNKTNMTFETRLGLTYPSWPRPRSHWSATGPRYQQQPTPTRERSRTSNSSTTGLHRSNRWAAPVRPVPARGTWKNLRTSHRSPLHRSGRCSLPVRSVQARNSQIHQTDLPSCKTDQTRKNSNTRQQGTHQDVHPSKTQQRDYTG